MSCCHPMLRTWSSVARVRANSPAAAVMTITQITRAARTASFAARGSDVGSSTCWPSLSTQMLTRSPT